VVGGGTAGVAFATRLSQRLANSSVLIIEAGPDGRSEAGIYIPGRKGSMLGSRYDWNFTSIPQSGANGRVIGQNRGRVLGGSSALNLLSWDRGAAADYDAWEELGNSGWNAESMFTAMRDAEEYHLTPANGSAELEGYGTDGPINFLINRWAPPQQEHFFPAMRSLGLSQTERYLDGELIGYMRHTSNIQPSNYTRSYSTAYLADAPSNLHILLETEVAKVNIDRNASATGVTLKDGTIISAVKEVILSAGTIQSAQLLELSGIGQKAVLEGAGVKQQVELPGVGENLQDHVRIVNTYQLRENYTTPDILRLNTTYAAEQLALWQHNETGLYDSTSSGYAYLQWDQILDNPASLISRANLSANASNVIDRKKLQNLRDLAKHVPQAEVLFSDGYLGAKGYPMANSSLYGRSFFALIGVLQHPFSRGSSHITSANSTIKPRFDPNYLSNPYDQYGVAYIAKYLRTIAQTPPMSYAWTAEYEPGPGVITTDEDWLTYARSNMASIWHPVGTCAMLPKAEGGVVSAELKVYGVHRLRVVDASIMPALVSGHIQSAVYGIAERAAQIVGEEWA
jgi:choline dehydrogenase-like flavoprotein